MVNRELRNNRVKNRRTKIETARKSGADESDWSIENSQTIDLKQVAIEIEGKYRAGAPHRVALRSNESWLAAFRHHLDEI